MRHAEALETNQCGDFPESVHVSLAEMQRQVTAERSARCGEISCVQRSISEAAARVEKLDGRLGEVAADLDKRLNEGVLSVVDVRSDLRVAIQEREASMRDLDERLRDLSRRMAATQGAEPRASADTSIVHAVAPDEQQGGCPAAGLAELRQQVVEEG